MLVSDMLDNISPNITLDYSDKSLPLLGGSLMGNHNKHPCSDGENDFKSQA